MTRTAVLGGEAGRRGFFGGQMSRTRQWALAGTGFVAAVLTIAAQTPGLVIGALLVGAAFTLTAGQNSVGMRLVARARLRDAAKTGTDAYRPFDPATWDELQAARGRRARREARRQAAALRQMPSGADGMGWLDMRPQHPGVAWHAPLGEEQYLSVAFSVSGQLRGIQSATAVEDAMERWGKFQAGLGRLSSLASGVQTLTRVLPPDSARHEAWVKSQLQPVPPIQTGDGDAAYRANLARQGHIEALRSYDHLLRMLSRGSMVSRHYVVVTWMVDAAFTAAAAVLGPGTDGWRSLMSSEIASISRRLQAAGLGQVQVLTARQTASVIRNMQHPDWPIDQAADIDPTAFGLASDPAAAAHHVHSPGPDGQVRDWYHATAQVDPASIATGARTALWLLPALTTMKAPIIRTVSITRTMVPAGQAKRAAREDVTADRADQLRQAKRGQIADEDTEVRLSAAKRRRQDLAPGSGHAGVEYLINVTVSARTPDALTNARRVMAETFDTALGIEGLVWLDSYQPAASGLTWPLARGLRPPKARAADKFERRTARRELP